mmetsp:Transcript_30900/g.100592  ORF Transcript_30900/g.100592 Transcript_30900/m.100592 type:complete len:337 (+) Transcript_30900:536-1546(+)
MKQPIISIKIFVVNLFFALARDSCSSEVVEGFGVVGEDERFGLSAHLVRERLEHRHLVAVVAKLAARVRGEAEARGVGVHERDPLLLLERVRAPREGPPVDGEVEVRVHDYELLEGVPVVVPRAALKDAGAVPEHLEVAVLVEHLLELVNVLELVGVRLDALVAGVAVAHDAEVFLDAELVARLHGGVIGSVRLLVQEHRDFAVAEKELADALPKVRKLFQYARRVVHGEEIGRVETAAHRDELHVHVHLIRVALELVRHHFVRGREVVQSARVLKRSFRTSLLRDVPLFRDWCTADASLRHTSGIHCLQERVDTITFLKDVEDVHTGVDKLGHAL